MEDFLMEHDNRHSRMHSLLFKPLKCWCCGELNEYDLPEGTKGLILLDAEPERGAGGPHPGHYGHW